MIDCLLALLVVLGELVPMAHSYCGPVSAERCVPCPPLYHRRPGYDLCYRVIGDEGKTSFRDARRVCGQEEGHLASILDQDTSDFIARLLVTEYNYKLPMKQSFWIGLTDRTEEGVFKWENPRDGYFAVGDFEQWGELQPDNGGLMVSRQRIRSSIPENCVVWQFTYSPHWRDSMCALYRKFICQVEVPFLRSVDTTRTLPESIQEYGNTDFVEVGILATHSEADQQRRTTTTVMTDSDTSLQVTTTSSNFQEDTEVNTTGSDANRSADPIRNDFPRRSGHGEPEEDRSIGGGGGMSALLLSSGNERVDGGKGGGSTARGSINTNALVIISCLLVLTVVVIVAYIAIKHVNTKQRSRQIGVLKQTGLYPNMSDRKSVV